MSSPCKRCVERGKTWSGSDPVCGFDASGAFNPDNWNCATLNALRDLASKGGTRLRYCAESACLIPIPEDGPGYFVLMKWYKDRGRTSAAWLLSSGAHEPLSLADAEFVLDHVSAEAIGRAIV